MSRRSLRVRLWTGALFSIGVALLVAGMGLITLFERHVERRIGEELRVQLNQLAAAVSMTEEGEVDLSREPSDPRFDQPLSGLYWQIDEPDQPGLLRSRSLWDAVIRLPDDDLEPGGVHAHQLPGPDGRPLLVRERRILLSATGTQTQLRLAVGIERAELVSARNDFAADMLPYLGLIALVLTLATFVQVQTGLAPLESVRRGLGSIRSGESSQLADAYPGEVMPLVAEVNALLAARAQAVERARAWTADLAHGLKTPLSALVADAQRLRASGNPELAGDLEQLAESMRRRVERELIRARVRSGSSSHQARVEVVAAIGRLVRTLERTPNGERLEWRQESSAPVMAALMPDDLMELLGNLLENAAKWASARVRVRVEVRGAWVEIEVGDDGPGVAEDQISLLGRRGLRLDERKDGSGLGLAIVRDVVDAYGGELCFDSAPEGGLRVRVKLPGVV
ncbi:sensor histidine kinase [Imhoffiella purpurea]|uniref:histidine kinase n=1 Tax=Imhoffiella purpurea TaxID=1249627 RepID=W9V7P4_9GAMM|nr:HAMP domain-containing sensor histidine kinase [Imhoffiella purpurea]EXJ15603.1 periplasmic sensor signal transduction histidine kinase [Imhoffiella purpurea]